MRKVNLYLTQGQYEMLVRLAGHYGTSMSKAARICLECEEVVTLYQRIQKKDKGLLDRMTAFLRKKVK